MTVSSRRSARMRRASRRNQSFSWLNRSTNSLLFNFARLNAGSGLASFGSTRNDRFVAALGEDAPRLPAEPVILVAQQIDQLLTLQLRQVERRQRLGVL